MTAQTVLDGEVAVRAAVGSPLGTSDWFDVTSQRLADFAAATGDPDATYFAVSLSNKFLPEIVEVRGFAMGVNYGTDKVHLGDPVQPGDRLRASATLTGVTDVNGGIQTRMVITVEADGRPPACVIESLSRWLG